MWSCGTWREEQIPHEKCRVTCVQKLDEIQGQREATNLGVHIFLLLFSSFLFCFFFSFLLGVWAANSTPPTEATEANATTQKHQLDGNQT